MTTEQYQMGYEAGYSDGFDAGAAPAAQPDDSDINQVHAANAAVTYPSIHFAAPAEQPLSDEQIHEHWYRTQGDAVKFAQAIERHHGIGVQK